MAPSLSVPNLHRETSHTNHSYSICVPNIISNNILLFCRAMSPIVHKQQTYRGAFVFPGSHFYTFTSWIMRQVVVLFFFFFSFPFRGRSLLRSITATAHDRRARRSTVLPILGSPDVTMCIFNLNFSIWIWAVELDWCFLWKILTWNLRSEFEQSNLINLNLFYLKFCKLIIIFLSEFVSIENYSSKFRFWEVNSKQINSDTWFPK